MYANVYNNYNKYYVRIKAIKFSNKIAPF